MHDMNGTPLKVGDRVTVEYVINGVSDVEGYCNISANSVHGRKPDGIPESFSGNSAVCVLQKRAPDTP